MFMVYFGVILNYIVSKERELLDLKYFGNYKDATIKESQKIQVFTEMMQFYYASLRIFHLSWHQYEAFEWTTKY
jgi:hypothetical protein